MLCRGGLIELNHLPPELRPFGKAQNEPESMTLCSMERHLISLALEQHNGNRKKAAAALGIDTSTLFRKIKAMNIDTPLADGRGRRG
ncbi:MAG: DNA-binding transcriptional regulator DhaR [Syntrophorhabdaceae bacterium PtaU1.Bin034]|nr:MAG: DNA-binding transcriptional regulator DhaR [Syntrophorhabdaceae bacterium PtaU1.Bin034]